MNKPTEVTSNAAETASCCDATSGCGCATDSSAALSTVFHPGVDVIETSQEYLIHADVPGATSDRIDIQFHEGILRVRAGVPQRHPEQARFLVREYGIGDFERSFRVSGQIQADHISAELKQGVLTLRLPKADEAKPRKIAVQSNN